MSGKRDLARENEIRRQTTRRKNADKVLIGYIKTMHPAVYGEAEKYLQGLVAEYPDKKDPSKTQRYQQMLRAKTNSVKHPAGNKVVKMDRFRLQIELNDYAKSSQTEVTTSNTPGPTVMDEATIQSSQTEVTTSNTPDATPTVMDEVTIECSQVEVTTSNTPDPQDATLTVMDEGTLEQMLADLREDPTIATFFSDFEHQLDNCPMW